MVQYLVPLLDIYLDIQKEHMSEYQKGEMIADFMVWHLRAMLVKYLDLYGASEMDLYLDNLFTCGNKWKMYF